jgi:hypothetical protein
MCLWHGEGWSMALWYGGYEVKAAVRRGSQLALGNSIALWGCYRNSSWWWCKLVSIVLSLGRLKSMARALGQLRERAWEDREKQRRDKLVTRNVCEPILFGEIC